jgi:peptidyl-prolyl cis-trans isomerase C
MKYSWIAMSLLGLLVLAGCNKAGTDAAARAATDTVATVNGKPISRNTYDYYAKGVAGKAASELSAEQRAELLDNLLRGEVVSQKIENDGVAKEPETAAVLDLSRLNVLQQIASQRYLKDRKATEQELRAEYETQVGALAKQEYHARHILVATEDFARRLIDQIGKGAKFEDLAKKESMDPSKTNGGDLGWFTPERMVKPFSDAVVALKKGQVTPNPVQTQFGWHVIRLDETRDVTPPSFDSVRDRLQQIVDAKKFKTYTDELVKNAKIEKKL